MIDLENPTPADNMEFDLLAMREEAAFLVAMSDGEIMAPVAKVRPPRQEGRVYCCKHRCGNKPTWYVATAAMKFPAEWKVQDRNLDYESCTEHLGDIVAYAEDVGEASVRRLPV